MTFRGRSAHSLRIIGLGTAALVAASSMFPPYAEAKEPAGTVQNAKPRQGALKAYRAVYDMRRGGKPWASAVVTLTPVRYQGADAYRHAITLRFEDESVFDETIFAAADFRLRAKFINSGVGGDLAWNFVAVRNGKLRGAQVFADARAPRIIEQKAPAAAQAGGYFRLAAAGLAAGREITVKGVDVGYDFETAMRVETREKITLGAGRAATAWRVALRNSLQPDQVSYIWLTEEPPYLLARRAPGQHIEWKLLSFDVFD